MNGIQNSIWVKCRLWYLDEEEDSPEEEEQQEDILEDTNENRFSERCVL